MNIEPEPFSTHRRWDDETHRAYADQPTRNGYHYRLDEKCSEAEKAAWREWCRKYPRHWPRHVRDFAKRSRSAK